MQVVGLHRAVPSASLDKYKINISFFYFYVKRNFMNFVFIPSAFLINKANFPFLSAFVEFCDEI